MKPGPQTGKASNGDARSFLTKAADAWGTVPDWVEALAAKADATGLKGAAEAIGYTPSLVSSTLNNKYQGDLARVEEMVRGALMAATVDCPVIGDIGRDRCLDEQKQEFRSTSAMRAQLYYACRNGCPHFRDTGRTAKPEGASDE
jgi:hypothetical protein